MTLCHYTFGLETEPARVKPRKNRGVREDARPPTERTAAGRYLEPSLFAQLQ